MSQGPLEPEIDRFLARTSANQADHRKEREKLHKMAFQALKSTHPARRTTVIQVAVVSLTGAGKSPQARRS